jgi:hypothetical protein
VNSDEERTDALSVTEKYHLVRPTWPKSLNLCSTLACPTRAAGASTEMGGAAVAVLAAAAARRSSDTLAAFVLSRVARGLHDAAAAAPEDKAGTRRRRRRSNSSLVLGPDFPDTWDEIPRDAARPHRPRGDGGERGLLIW